MSEESETHPFRFAAERGKDVSYTPVLNPLSIGKGAGG